MVYRVSYKRHLFKSISWRVVGTLDTIFLSGIVTGSWLTGFAIGGFEIFTKMILYFFHERLWYRFIKFGIKKDRVKKQQNI